MPRFRPPRGAWDTHFHVLGPLQRYPYTASRKYTPPPALLPDYLALLDRLGLDRAVVVHPNIHGFDNAVDLDAIAASEGRLMGVVRLDRSVTSRQIRAMHAAGVRGVRFAFNPQHGGALDLDTFNYVKGCLSEVPWFIELHLAPAALVELKTWLEAIREPLVIDHMGRIDVRLGTEQVAFRNLLHLVSRDNVWVKLSGADRTSAIGPPYADVIPFARKLIDTAPDRMLWGSDWPHTGIFDPKRMPDDGQLLDALADFAVEEETRNKILVQNPCRLLGQSTL